MGQNFNMRLDEDLKALVYPILAQYGLTPSQAVRMFFNQIAQTGKVPLSFDWAEHRIPNAETAEIIRQGRAEYRAGQLKGYSKEQAHQAFLEALHED